MNFDALDEMTAAIPTSTSSFSKAARQPRASFSPELVTPHLRDRRLGGDKIPPRRARRERARTLVINKIISRPMAPISRDGARRQDDARRTPFLRKHELATDCRLITWIRRDLLYET